MKGFVQHSSDILIDREFKLQAVDEEEDVFITTFYGAEIKKPCSRGLS